MTTQSLSAVASHIVGQYSQASKHMVDAYRHGAQRLVIGANTRYVTFLKSGAVPLVNDDVKTRIFKVQTQITSLSRTASTTVPTVPRRSSTSSPRV